MLIRAEEPEDRAAVFAVNQSAFETPTEARLVDALCEQARPVVSLVAEEDGSILGHILFTVVLPAHPELKIMGLAPMVVAPAHQRKGIGSCLHARVPFEPLRIASILFAARSMGSIVSRIDAWTVRSSLQDGDS